MLARSLYIFIEELITKKERYEEGSTFVGNNVGCNPYDLS